MRTELRRSGLCETGLWKSGAVLGLAVLAGASGCKSNQTANTPAPIVDANGGPDPAAVNNAPVSGTTTGGTGTAGYAPSAPSSSRQPARVMGQQAYAPPPSSSAEQYPEQYPEQYSQQAAPAYPAGQGQPYPTGNSGSAGDYDAAYDQQVNAGQDALYASQPPPPLPVYEQPELTDPGDQWTPGYWSYAPQGYYWVPGAWVAPPFTGALWTPGYWGFYGGRYRFNHGFWGQHIGFYGGVPYGFGYTGHGYEGGYWNGNRFFYNNAVNRVNVNVVHNVYVRNVTVVNNTRVSYNGPGGWNARPTASDVAVLHEQRVPAMQVQRQRAQEAASNRQQFVSENHGRPAMAVAQRQPADRVAPAALAPIGRPEGGNAQRAGQPGQGQAGGFAPGNGAGRTVPEQGRGQAGFAARSNEPQPGNAGRPAPQEQTRPGNQPQTVRPQPETQPRSVPEAQRPISSQPRTPSPDQQRQLQEQQRQEQQRQLQGQRPIPSEAQPARPQQQARPEAQPEPVSRPQAQPRPQPQVQEQPRPQPQAQPHPQPQARPQPAPHPEESHPHV